MKSSLNGTRKPKYVGLAVLLTLLATMMLTACGGETTPAPEKKEVDLPKDRALILSNKDGWPDLYTVDLSGKFTGRLTESAAAEYGATWSPDGRKVAFTELNGDQAAGDYSRNRRLVVIDADGKNRRIITQDGIRPVWSPDGQKLLFTRITNSILGETAPDKRPVANIAAPPEQATVTPAPTATVNSRGIIQPTSRAVVIGTTPMVIPGSFATPVYPNPTLSTTPAARPDSTPVTIPDLQEETPPTPVSGSGNVRAAQVGLFVVNIEGGQPTQLVPDALSGVWSPDGKRIAYIGGNNVIDQKRNLNLVNADGNGRISLTERASLSELDVLYVAWSPDGTNLAFTATDPQKNKTTLYRLSPDGNSARRLTDYDGAAREVMSLIWAYADYYNPAPRLQLGPVWSPNSRSLVFSDGSARLTVVDASNASVRYFPVGSAVLGQDKDSVLNVSWLSDSRRLLYDRADAGRSTLQSQAGSYIYDFFDETLETLDTVNKNTTTLMSGPGATLIPNCCGMDLLGAGSPSDNKGTATAAPKSTSTPGPGLTVADNQGKLIYVSGIGQRQLIVNDLKTNTRNVITSGLFKLIDFNLAPKGQKMTYIEVGERFNATLYVANLEGKNKRKLSAGNGNPDDLSYLANWSPDGKQLAFQALNDDPNLKPGLYTLPVDDTGAVTGNPRLITNKNATAFAWSPDSKQLAYRVPASTYELYISAADGSTSGQLIASLGRFDTRYSSLGKGMAWSPDGRHIAISGATNNTYNSMWQLWLVTPQGKVEEYSGYFISRIVGFTPDGSRLIATMASSNQRSTIQGYVMPNNQSSAQGWRSYDLGAGPTVAPDSGGMAYYSRAGESRISNTSNTSDGIGRVVMLNFANGVTRPVTLDYTPYYAFKSRFFAWEPSGKALAFYENNTIHVVNAQGGQLRREVLSRAFAVDKLAWTQ